MKKIKTICPRCGGSGFARAYNKEKRYSDKIIREAKVLYEKGLTLRDVCKKLKIKHPQTVKNLISYELKQL